MAARNALWAPAHVVQQRSPSGVTGVGAGVDSAPSVTYLGEAIQDHRLPYNKYNSANAAGVIGWYGSAGIVLNAQPAALSAVNIAAAQVPVAATPLTLRAATGAGITVLAATFLALPSLTTIPVAALALDGNPGYLRFGLNFFTVFYDFTKALARNVRFTSVGNDSAATAKIVGFDVYGYAMSEVVTLSNASIASGKKAFKWITSITPAGTLSGSNLSVGTGDVFGFPLRVDQWGYVYIIYNGTTITANTGFLAADTTSPATTTTGDVRGTYAVQSASDGTKRLEVSVAPNIVALQSDPTVGLFGVPQV